MAAALPAAGGHHETRELRCAASALPMVVTYSTRQSCQVQYGTPLILIPFWGTKMLPGQASQTLLIGSIMHARHQLLDAPVILDGPIVLNLVPEARDPRAMIGRLTGLGFEVFHLSPELAQARYFVGRSDKLTAPHFEQVIAATV
jgi:hypothetical protein